LAAVQSARQQFGLETFSRSDVQKVVPLIITSGLFVCQIISAHEDQ